MHILILLLTISTQVRAQKPTPFRVYLPISSNYQTYEDYLFDSTSSNNNPFFKASINILINESKPYDARSFEIFISNLSDTPLVILNVRHILSNIKVKCNNEPIESGKHSKLATVQISSPSPQVPFVKWCEIITNKGIVILQFRQRGLETVLEH